MPGGIAAIILSSLRAAGFDKQAKPDQVIPDQASSYYFARLLLQNGAGTDNSAELFLKSG